MRESDFRTESGFCAVNCRALGSVRSAFFLGRSAVLTSQSAILLNADVDWYYIHTFVACLLPPVLESGALCKVVSSRTPETRTHQTEEPSDIQITIVRDAGFAVYTAF